MPAILSRFYPYHLDAMHMIKLYPGSLLTAGPGTEAKIASVQMR